MGKGNIVSIICFFLIFIISCRESNKEIKLINRTHRTEKREEFHQINFSTVIKDQDILKGLDIKFEDIRIKLKFVEDRSYLKYFIKGKQISDWQQISYNFTYDNSFEDAQKGIRILYNSHTRKGFLLLPGYTEEYPIFNVYQFDPSTIFYLQNILMNTDNCNIREKTAINAFIKNNQVSFGFSDINGQNKDCTFVKEEKNKILHQFEKKDLQFINENESSNRENISSISDGEYFIDDDIQDYEISLIIKKDSVIYTETGNRGKIYNQYVLSKERLADRRLLLKYRKTLEGFTGKANQTSQFGFISGQNDKVYLTGSYIQNRFNLPEIALKKEQ